MGCACTRATTIRAPIASPPVQVIDPIVLTNMSRYSTFDNDTQIVHGNAYTVIDDSAMKSGMTS